MHSDPDLAYHGERAKAELDQAYRAEHQAAIDAHLKLAALHMDRLRTGDEQCGGSSIANR